MGIKIQRDNIERIFYEDVAEKKRAARGIHAMTGKRGHVGKMVMPSDRMSKKEKQQYIRGGEIMTTNFYQDISNIPTLSEIQEKFKQDPTGTTKFLETIKGIHTGSVLSRHWGYKSPSSIFNVWKKYGIESSTKKRHVNKSEVITRSTPPPEFKLLEEQKNIFLQQVQNQLIQSTHPDEDELFSIKYNKKGSTGEEIANRLSYLLGVLESDVSYQITLTIKENNQDNI